MRYSKQITGVMISFAMVAAMIPADSVRAQENESPQEVNVQQEQKAAETAIPKIRLSVGTGQKTPKYNAGDKASLVVKVENAGNTDAQNVRITPVIDNASDWPFEIEDMNYEQNLGTVKAGEAAEAKWELTVRSDVETKSYKTPFTISYDDGQNEYPAAERTIYVRTTAKPKPEDQNKDQNKDQQGSQNQGENNGADAGWDGSGISAQQIADAGGVYNGDITASGGNESDNKSVPRVIVTGFSTDPGTVNAGNNFKLTVHVKNTSTTTDVCNMLFDMQAPSAGTDAAAEAPAFLPASGSSSIYLDRIPAGGTKDISIDLNARADLVQKPYSIAMSMKYEDGNAAQYEGQSSLAIPVQQAARFEFSDIELSPESIQVGEEANLTCSIYNTGRVKLYNVKVKFSGDGISGKDVFVGNVESGATGTVDGMLTGESEVPAGTKCKMTVSYEDESGKVSTAEKEFEMEVTPAADQGAEMTGMEAQGQQKSFPVIPVVIAVVVLAAVVVAVMLVRRKKRKQALLIEEDLADEVDRFTEDE